MVKKRPGTFIKQKRTISSRKAGRPGSKGGFKFGSSSNLKRYSNDKNSASRRPGQLIADRDFEKALDYLDSKNYLEASKKLRSMSDRYSPTSKEAMLITYNLAETYFYSKSMSQAKKAYIDFLKRFPNSPLAENAKAAIKFIDNFKRFKNMYTSPDDMK